MSNRRRRRRVLSADFVYWAERKKEERKELRIFNLILPDRYLANSLSMNDFCLRYVGH